MRNHLPPQSLSEPVQAQPTQCATGPHFKCPFPPRSLAILGAVALLVLAAAVATAQTPAAQPATPAAPPDQKTTHEHKRPRAIHPLPVTAPVALAPVTPQAPAIPNWPAFNQAAQASVIWDSRGLSVDAANSSLQQILKDVSTATGTKVEGLSTDQRVFGDYGPGQARDVLSQLLQGSGYNVLMIGDQGQGVPRQILLSARQASGGGQTAAARQGQPGNDDEDSEEPAQTTPEPGPQNHPGFGPGYQPGAAPAPTRTPQELMQELQQRQQQQQQQQPQQQQNNPPN